MAGSVPFGEDVIGRGSDAFGRICSCVRAVEPAKNLYDMKGFSITEEVFVAPVERSLHQVAKEKRWDLLDKLMAHGQEAETAARNMEPDYVHSNALTPAQKQKLFLEFGGDALLKLSKTAWSEESVKDGLR